MIWKFLERGGTQIVQFVLSIILARMLLPSDYGIIALLMVFIQIANVFIQSGFTSALVQKRDADDLDFASVFYFSLFVAFILYAIIFFCAPLIAAFYKMDLLTRVVRVLAITLFFGALNSVQSAVVAKTMQFKRLFFSSLGAVLGSGAIGIFLAFRGAGVWSLVVQQLSNIVLVSLILFYTVRWRPGFMFSANRLFSLFSYGWKVLCSGLIDTIYNNIYNLSIGKIYDSKILGVYSRGQQFPLVLVSNLDGAIQGVMLPTISSHQNDIVAVKRITRRSITTSTFFVFPCIFGLIAVANPLVSVLLTPKWLDCVPFLQLACIAYALWPIHTTNLTAIAALGRSDIFLKLEIVKKAIAIVIFLVSIPFGIYAMMYGQIISGVLSAFVNAYPNKKLLDYSYSEQIKDIIPSFFLSCFMAIIVYCINFIELADVFTLILQILVGIVVYFSCALFFRLEVYSYLLSSMKERKK